MLFHFALGIYPKKPEIVSFAQKFPCCTLKRLVMTATPISPDSHSLCWIIRKQHCIRESSLIYLNPGYSLKFYSSSMSSVYCTLAYVGDKLQPCSIPRVMLTSSVRSSLTDNTISIQECIMTIKCLETVLMHNVSNNRSVDSYQKLSHNQ